MARPKAKPKPKAKALGVRQKNILALKGSDEYKNWLDDLAAFNKAPLTTTIEQAMEEFAMKRKFRKSPPRVP